MKFLIELFIVQITISSHAGGGIMHNEPISEIKMQQVGLKAASNILQMWGCTQVQINQLLMLVEKPQVHTVRPPMSG